MNDKKNTDALLRRALGGVEAPAPALLRQVKASLRKEQDMKTNKTTKRIITVALAAALVLALSVTAYAALDAADWFKDWFAERTDSQLTEGQQAYIDKAAAGIGQSVTADGWTVTLESAMTDGRYCYMKLAIRLPEGTDQERVQPILNGTLTSTDPNAPEKLFSGGSMSIPLDCENGLYGQMMEQSMPTTLQETDIDWSYPLVLTLDLLENGRADGRVLSRGPWVFEFTVTPPEHQEMELVSEPFTATGIVTTYYYKGVPLDQVEKEPGIMLDSGNGLTSETEDVDVTVTSIRISSMNAVLTYRCRGEIIPDLDPWGLEITLAGGVTVDIGGSGGHLDEETGDCIINAEFRAPIDLDEVTAASFQGHALTVPRA